MEETTTYAMPRIGDQAPNFKANTTKGPIEMDSFGKDKWIVMFSHPADFTPVCTTEMSGFAVRKPEFDELNTELLGLSIDSIHSYLGWVENVHEKTGVYFDFPIIADIDMKVSKLYGMLQPNESETAAVRAVFFIDPKGIIRTMIYYPLSLGRNFQELYRVLIGLKTADKNEVALPADWQPGDDVIVPTAGSCGVAEDRISNKESDIHCHDWFFCTKKLSEEEVKKAIEER